MFELSWCVIVAVWSGVDNNNFPRINELVSYGLIPPHLQASHSVCCARPSRRGAGQAAPRTGDSSFPGARVWTRPWSL